MPRISLWLATISYSSCCNKSPSFLTEEHQSTLQDLYVQWVEANIAPMINLHVENSHGMFWCRRLEYVFCKFSPKHCLISPMLLFPQHRFVPATSMMIDAIKASTRGVFTGHLGAHTGNIVNCDVNMAKVKKLFNEFRYNRFGMVRFGYFNSAITYPVTCIRNCFINPIVVTNNSI